MANRHDEAVICLHDAILMARAPSELRFLLAQMVKYRASREHLEEQFFENLRADDEETEDSVHYKMTALLCNEIYPDGGQNEDQNIRMLDPNSELSCLIGEQLYVATQIINAVLQNTHQLLFLQGAAGTGKTFTVNTLIKELQSTYRKNCLICATTGIAAVQYPGVTTLHSLFRLGIDEEVQGSFRCNIRRNTSQTRHLFRADLIIADEVSMLTAWVANRVSLTLQSISVHSTRPFGGKALLFVGDLLPLPPVVKNFSMPLVCRLITHSTYWRLMKKFQLDQPRRTENSEWAEFLLSIAKGNTGDIQNWRQVAEKFGVTLTDNLNVAQTFLCADLQPGDPFPFDRLWICPTNRGVNDVNDPVQKRRGQHARFLGIVYAFSELLRPLKNARVSRKLNRSSSSKKTACTTAPLASR
jgi:hypothetical protein